MAWNSSKQALDDFKSTDWNTHVTDQENRCFRTSGVGAPTSTPTMVGAVYIDTTNKKFYFAVGMSSSADWKKVMSQ